MLPLSLLFWILCLCLFVDASAVHALEDVSLEVVWRVTEFFILGYQPMKSAKNIHNRQDLLANLIFIFNKLFSHVHKIISYCENTFLALTGLGRALLKNLALKFRYFTSLFVTSRMFSSLSRKKLWASLKRISFTPAAFVLRMFYLQFSIHLTF